MSLFEESYATVHVRPWTYNMRTYIEAGQRDQRRSDLHEEARTDTKAATAAAAASSRCSPLYYFATEARAAPATPSLRSFALSRRSFCVSGGGTGDGTMSHGTARQV